MKTCSGSLAWRSGLPDFSSPRSSARRICWTSTKPIWPASKNCVMWHLDVCPSYSRSGGSTRSKPPNVCCSRLLITNITVLREYSGAAIIPKQPTQAVTPRSELCPDSLAPRFESLHNFEPGLESRQLSEDEEDARLMQHARLESLEQASRDNDRFFAAHADLLAAAGNSSRSPSRSPTPPLPVEYNNEGWLTAAAKGKHRSN